MLFRTSLLRRPMAKSPFEVLGVCESTPLPEIKRQFQCLARKYHPDTPTGNPERFREIHAAWQIIRSGQFNEARRVAAQAAYDRRAAAGGRTPFSRSDGAGAPYCGARMSPEEAEAMKQEVSSRKGFLDSVYGDHRNRRGLYFACGLIGGGTLGCAGQYYAARNRYLARRVEMEEMINAPPPLPGNVERHYREEIAALEAAARRMKEAPSAAMLTQPHACRQSDAADAPAAAGEGTIYLPDDSISKERQELLMRRVAQRRFDDLREYYFVNDPDGCTSRKFQTHRFWASLVDADRVAERCPIVVHYDSSAPNASYDRDVVAPVQQAFNTKGTHFSNVDAEAVALHTTMALGKIPKMTPHQNRWSFIEYKDNNMPRRDPPRCLVAIFNKRHETNTEAFAQRAIVSGAPELQPRLMRRRQQQLDAGELDASTMILGGVLPIKMNKNEAAEEAAQKL